jgi:hypothetical protein
MSLCSHGACGWSARLAAGQLQLTAGVLSPGWGWGVGGERDLGDVLRGGGAALPGGLPAAEGAAASVRACVRVCVCVCVCVWRGGGMSSERQCPGSQECSSV